MTGISPATLPPRKRRRKVAIPTSHRLADAVILLVFLSLSIGCVWVLGGNRFWIMGPMIFTALLAGMIWVWRFFVSADRHDLLVPPGAWIGLLLLAYLGAILPFAQVPYDAQLEVFRFVSYALASWVLVNELRFNGRWKWALGLMLLSISVMAGYALIQNAQGTRMVLFINRPDDYGMRASGAYVCPNHFAHLLQMAVPVSLGLIFSRGAGVPIKLFAGYAALISLPALYLTDSRSGWIGLLVGGIVFFISLSIRSGFKKFLVTLIIAPALALAVGLAMYSLSPRVQMRVDKAIQGDIRIAIWKDSWEMVKESPWIGNGLGSYRAMFGHFRNHIPIRHDPEFAHNDYLHFWSEIGAVGLLFFAVLFLAVVWRSIRIIRRDTEGFRAPLMAGLLGMLAGSLSHAFFDFNFHIFANVHVVVLFIAALFAAACNREEGRFVVVSSPRYRALGGMLLLALAALSLLYGRMLVSYFHEISGDSRIRQEAWEEAGSDYKKAIAWSPGNWRAHLGLAHVMRARSFWMRNPALREPWMDEARQHYELVGQMNPWEPEVWYGLGSLYNMRGDPEAALAMRYKTVDRVPRNIFYLNALGLQLREMRRHEEALAVFITSYNIEPSPVSIRNIEQLNARLSAP